MTPDDIGIGVLFTLNPTLKENFGDLDNGMD